MWQTPAEKIIGRGEEHQWPSSWTHMHAHRDVQRHRRVHSQGSSLAGPLERGDFLWPAALSELPSLPVPSPIAAPSVPGTE